MLKNKIIVKKIRNIVILLMSIIVMIGAYQNIRDSRAEDVIVIGASAKDNYGYLENEEFMLEAIQVENDLYEIQLPESINTKKVNQILKVTLTDSEGNETVVYGGEPQQDAEQEDTEQDNTATEPVEGTEQQEEMPSNIIQLTKEQIDTQTLNIEAVYDVAILEKDEQGQNNKILLSEKTEEERAQIQTTEITQTLYNKILKYEDIENGKLVEVKGYLPKDAQLKVEEVSEEQLKQIFGEKPIQVAYDIKIIVEVKTEVPTDEADPEAEPEYIVETVEINPEEFGETCEVSIKDASIIENSQVYHVKEDNTYEEVNVKESVEESISFEAKTFSVYAVGGDYEVGDGEEGGEGGDDGEGGDNGEGGDDGEDDEGIELFGDTYVTTAGTNLSTWKTSHSVKLTPNFSYGVKLTTYYWYDSVTDSSGYYGTLNTTSNTSLTAPAVTGKWRLYITYTYNTLDENGAILNNIR